MENKNTNIEQLIQHIEQLKTVGKMNTTEHEYKGEFLFLLSAYRNLVRKHSFQETNFFERVERIGPLNFIRNHSYHIDLDYRGKNYYRRVRQEVQRVCEINPHHVTTIILVTPSNHGITHTILIIYRKQENVVELFDPANENNVFIANEVRAIFNKARFVNSDFLCSNREGLQIHEQRASINFDTEIGKCGIWSLLIMDYVHLFPTMTTKEIIDVLYNYDNISLKHLIIGYIIHHTELQLKIK